MTTYEKNPDAIARLSPEQYRVTQQNGTEPPGTGEYLHNKEPGLRGHCVRRAIVRFVRQV